MRTGPRFSYLWPGLNQLWHEGQWRGLVIASCFALLLNVALAGTFIWTELLGGTLRLSVWLAVSLFWVVSARGILRAPVESRGQVDHSEGDVGLFVEAQGEYLRGNWFAAEALLNQTLVRCPDDAESRLLLATMFRRTRRTVESGSQLDRLGQFPTATNWRWEVEAEQKLLAQQVAEMPMAEGTATETEQSECHVEHSFDHGGASDASQAASEAMPLRDEDERDAA